jgi:DNA-binding NtrC family response regulator
MSDTLLIIEDEQLLGSELVRHYRRASWEIVWAKTFREARRHLFDEELEPMVVLSDINLPDGNGLDLLDEVRQRGGRGEWVFLTGYGEVPDSVRAIRLGAYDFLTKPCQQERLDLVVNGAARSASAQRRLKDENESLTRRYTPESFVGRSRPARTTSRWDSDCNTRCFACARSRLPLTARSSRAVSTGSSSTDHHLASVCGSLDVVAIPGAGASCQAAGVDSSGRT